MTGCDQASTMNKIIPPDVEAIAKNYINLLRSNNFDVIEKDLDPSGKGPNIRETLASMAALIPAKQPISIKVVGAQVSNFPLTARAPVARISLSNINSRISGCWLMLPRGKKVVVFPSWDSM